MRTEGAVLKVHKTQIATVLLAAALIGYACGSASAAVRIEGQVQAGGSPLASSTITLWAASSGEPEQLAQTKSGSDGRFELRTAETREKDIILYLIAKGGIPTINKGSGDNPAIALLTVLGNKPPAKVVINEMTTVASVWTHAQFLDGTAVKGRSGCALRLATCPTSSISKPADGAKPSRGRSIAAKPPQWPTSPPWPMCSPVAPRG
jgi:hypothetical protein